MPNIPWRKSGDGWYSNLRGGFKVTYDSVGPVQFSFLRMLSLEARQNFTYTCINSVAWYDNVARGYSKSIKLLGDNDDEFSAVQNKPQVSTDGCRTRGSESKTILLLSQPNFHNCQSWIFSPSIMGYHTKPLALKLDLYVSNDTIFPILVFKHYYLLL